VILSKPRRNPPFKKKEKGQKVHKHSFGAKKPPFFQPDKTPVVKKTVMEKTKSETYFKGKFPEICNPLYSLVTQPWEKKPKFTNRKKDGSKSGQQIAR